MQLTTTLLATILSATTVFATPTVTERATIPDWTITSMKRVCNTVDTSCAWTFGIQTNTGAATVPCSFTISGTKADQGNLTAPKACGTFSVTAGWSGQFGPGNGFTTLSVYNNANKQIAWPAYTDTELAGGKFVSPDKKWTVTQM
ncbi:hypothetical protein GGR57DRAFT_333499 [Xylariaceae sp. FL1272]|nr:hypothetical protein GGR57DRAFT_333499 [Xylariaceae sp. FL1272]